jgi:hypothetical protein
LQLTVVNCLLTLEAIELFLEGARPTLWIAKKQHGSMHVYLQNTRYIYLLLSERVDRTCVQRWKKTSTTGHTTTCHLAPTGFQGSTLFQLWNRSGRPAVLAEMNDGSVNQASATRVWIPIGSALFLIALTVSARVVPQLRLLHLLQAFIYVVIVILARRNSVWGFGAGVTIRGRLEQS